MIKYLHLRYHDVEEDEDEIRHTLASTGGVTVAFELKDNMITYSMAKCRWTDNYSKKIGRDIALGRLLKGNHMVSSFESKDGVHPAMQIRDHIYETYEANGYEQLIGILY